MQFINQLLENDFFLRNTKEKRLFFNKNLNLLTKYHFKNSEKYKKILAFFNYNPKKLMKLKSSLS